MYENETDDACQTNREDFHRLFHCSSWIFGDPAFPKKTWLHVYSNLFQFFWVEEIQFWWSEITQQSSSQAGFEWRRQINGENFKRVGLKYFQFCCQSIALQNETHKWKDTYMTTQLHIFILNLTNNNSH